ncbi:MAG: DUF3106 domain-containing protein [Noviherbaspirillum sp.]
MRRKFLGLILAAAAAGSGLWVLAAGAGVQDPKPWADLSSAQRRALAPLEARWDDMDAVHKRRWMEIGRNYASLRPEQQDRLHDRMRDWTELTPEQRGVARESYARARKLDPDEKAARWEQYQQLSDEQKAKLAAETKKRKRVASLPPASQGKGKMTPLPKSQLKSALRAAQPPAPAAAIEPSPKPAPE